MARNDDGDGVGTHRSSYGARPRWCPQSLSNIAVGAGRAPFYTLKFSPDAELEVRTLQFYRNREILSQAIEKLGEFIGGCRQYGGLYIGNIAHFFVCSLPIELYKVIRFTDELQYSERACYGYRANYYQGQSPVI